MAENKINHPFYLIFEKQLEETTKPQYELDNVSPVECFGPINRINVFVGSNNSGKSRFMRALIQSDKTLSTNPINPQIVINDALSIIRNFIKQNASYNAEFRLSHRRFNLENLSEINALKLQEIPFQTKELSEIVNKLTGKTIEQIYTNAKLEFEKLMLIISIIGTIDIEKVSHSYLYHSISQATGNWQNQAVNIKFNTDPSNIKIPDISNKFISEIQELINLKAKEKTKRINIYTPLLRTAHSVYSDAKKLNKKDLYAETVYRNYFDPEGKKPQLNITLKKANEYHDLKLDDQIIKIYTGMNLHKHMRKIRNSVKDDRDKFEEFEAYLGQKFFKLDRLEIIARELDDADVDQEHIQVYFSNDKTDLPIHNLGDGIQALILVLYNVFTAADDSLIYIEEPEMHLHPGLQRTFLDAIKEQAEKKNLTIFFTTHSNHMLDISIGMDDISIFTFKQNGKRRIINNVKSQDLDILNVLEVQNSSVFMANCAIWVEGHTDRKYIKKYLDEYIKHHKKHNNLDEFIEDLHFTFFLYAGSNVKHYLFNKEIKPETVKEKVNALSNANRMLLIADQDQGKDDRHKLREELSSLDGPFQYYVVKEVIEIENLLSREVLVETVKGGALPAIKNEDTNEILSSPQDLKTTHLGAFLKTIYHKNWQDSYGDKTIGSNYKGTFAEEAIKHITWDNMTEPAKKLAEVVYKFIQRHNQ